MTSSSSLRRRLVAPSRVRRAPPGRLAAVSLTALSIAAMACGGGGSKRSAASTSSSAAGATSSSSSSAAPAHRGPVAFTDVRVFDGKQTISEATVIIEGERITAVQTGGAVPRGALVIDGQGKTLLPGFIDGHAHIHDAWGLEQSLAFGVTTVLDMFSLPQVVKQLRDEDHPGRADLRSAGYLATAPGGHGTQFGFGVPTLTRPDEAGPWVAARVAEGSDYIKIVLSGKPPTLDVATFDALVRAAHGQGKLAVVHINNYDNAILAVEHGADGLVHLFRDRVPPASFGTAVAARKAFVVPTLAVSKNAYGQPSTLGADGSISPWLPESVKEVLAAGYDKPAQGPAEAVPRSIQLLRDAGAELITGTDAPNKGTAYGASIHEELALLVAAGLSPSQALAAATATPAARFGLRDRGRIAPGLRADLVLVAGDPTRDINATRFIAGIWRGGQRFDRDAYKRRFGEIDKKMASMKAAMQMPPPATTATGAATAATTGTGTAPTAPTSPTSPAATLGVVSDFDLMPTEVKAGQPWAVATDEQMGGSSKAALAMTGGAHGSNGSLEISGTLVKLGPVSWSGAIWMPGARAFDPVDLSKKAGFTFQARGDGKVYTVMLFTGKGGMRPSFASFTPGKSFAPVSFTWSQFKSDGADVTAILIGQSAVPGEFRLVIDDFELK